MNRSNWEHVAIALLVQALVGIVSGDLWIGAAFAIGLFLGREHAQREYQVTKGGPVGNLNVFAGLKGWSKDTYLDFFPASIAVIVVAIISKGI